MIYLSLFIQFEVLKIVIFMRRLKGSKTKYGNKTKACSYFSFCTYPRGERKMGTENQNNITMLPNILEIDPVWSWGLLGTLGAGTIWLSQYFSDHHLTVECFLAWWWHEIGCRVLWQLMIYVPPFPVASLCSSSSSQVCCLEQWYDLCSCKMKQYVILFKCGELSYPS